MGIILASFRGCGKTYLTNSQSDKVKVFDATEFDSEVSDNERVDDILNHTIDTDIVFVGVDDQTLDALDSRNVDYDVFYPSKERRGEFIENQVIKRSNPKIIQELDRYFDKWVDAIDEREAPNCFKHKMVNKGEFIGNSPIINTYISSLKNDPMVENNSNKIKDNIEE